MKDGPHHIKQGIGIVLNMPFWHNDVEILLDFHIFEVIDFGVMIGHPIEKLFLEETTLGKLNMTLGGKTLPTPITRIMITKAE